VITDLERDAPVQDFAGRVPMVGPADIEIRLVARAPAAGWPATTLEREQVFERLTGGPFALEGVGGQKRRRHGLATLLDWLGAQPGGSWQARWLASGADAAGGTWRQMPERWLATSGRYP
jgi:hypothetical protein